RQPARVQRTPRALARERRCLQTLGGGASIAAIATGSDRVTAGGPDYATTANTIAAAAAHAGGRATGRTGPAQPPAQATARRARRRSRRRAVWLPRRNAASHRRHGRVDRSGFGHVRRFRDARDWRRRGELRLGIR